jgi:hypothetical protein
MFCTPSPRQSLKLSCSHSATPMWLVTRQPSFVTEISSAAWRPSRSAASLRSRRIACCQGATRRSSGCRARQSRAPRRGRGPRWSVRRTCRADRPRRGAAGRARKSGWPRKSSALGAETPATIASRGGSSASTTIGRVGSPAPDSRATASSATRRPAFSSGSSSRRSAARATERSRLRLPPPPAARAQWVQPHLAAGGEADRLHLERPRERPVLALGIDHPGLAAEEDLAVDVGLDQARLARVEVAEAARRGAS